MEIVFGAAGFVLAWCVFGGVRIVNQIERGVVFRFGRARKRVRQPGLAVLIPFVDRLRRINVQVVTLPVPTQEGITRDNVSVKVDAVVYFRVEDPHKAMIEVQNYRFAIEQVAQTSLRSIIGKSELDDLLTNREQLHRGLELMIDSPALGWGVHIDRVEIKDVQLPESMRRSMSRQAEAERERRARVITADGELQAAQKLADASAIMAETPGALQLRLLQTVVEVAAEKNSTLVMPLPVEMLRFFDRLSAAPPPAPSAGAATVPDVEPPVQALPAAPTEPLPSLPSAEPSSQAQPSRQSQASRQAEPSSQAEPPSRQAQPPSMQSA